MLNEIITILKNGLAHTTYGVNAKIAGLTLIGSDTRPGSIQSITSEIDDDSTAIRLVPESTGSLPAIAISIPKDIDVVADVQSDTQDANILVNAHVVFYRDDKAQAIKDFYYTLRAMKQSVVSLIDSLNEADRTSNNIQLVSFSDGSHIQVIELSKPKEDGWLTGGLRMMFAVRDLAP